MKTNLLLLISLSVFSLLSMDESKQLASKGFVQAKALKTTERITAQDCEQAKMQLSYALRRFVDDFSTWSSEEKRAVRMHTLGNGRPPQFTIGMLSQDRLRKYGDSPTEWLDSQLNYHLREPLAVCVNYYKQQ